MIEIMPCFFSRRMKLTCIISEQSIAAIMYDGGRTNFDIDKILFPVDFVVEFVNEKGRADLARPFNSNPKQSADVKSIRLNFF